MQHAGWCLGIALLFALCLVPPGRASGQDILIFRPDAEPRTEYTTPNIVLTLQISAFSPIQSVRVNDQPIKAPKATFVLVFQPLQLHPGLNRIVVEATTEFETAHQEFIFNLKLIKSEPGAAERPRLGYQFTGLAGLQYSSNPTKAAGDAATTPGTRSFLIGVPRYDISTGPQSRLRLQSIISRDRYDVKSLAVLEVALTQLTASLLVGEKKPSEWALGVGYNYIDQTYRTLLKGQVHLEDDSFVFGSYERQFGKGSAWSLGLEYKNQNLKAEASDPDREEDARVTTGTGNLLWVVGPVRVKGLLSSAVTDAIGKYKDQTTSRARLEFARPMGSFLPSLGVRIKKIVYKEVDPLLGGKPDSLLTSGVLTVNYQLSASLVALIEAVKETQTSAVPSAAYNNQSLMLALAYIY